MATLPIPISGRLVPEVVPTPPEGFTVVEQPLVAGPIQRIPLDGGIELTLVVPTGLASAWRDADPAEVVSHSATALAPAPGSGGTPAGPAPAPVRLLVRRAGAIVASVPLIAGLRRRVPDAGGDDRGVEVELVVLSWDLRAGTLRGPGQFGSRVELAWRRAGPPSLEPGAGP